MRALLPIGAIASLMWHSLALRDATPPTTAQDPSDVLTKLQAMSMQALEGAERKLTQYGWPTKSRYDDFVAVHVNMTTTIHNTGNFLGWHRYFVHVYETVLRDECGYTGYSPYWNWFAHRDDVTKSPVFDGSPTSLGGDGEFFYHPGTPGGVLQIPLPSGRGGGCIKEGPFAGQQVSVGPLLSVFEGFPTVKDLFVPNPHCIRRDLNSYVTANYFTTEALLNVTLGAASGSIKRAFRAGGDGTDVFSSPNDPAFFLHHAMVDRVWWMWQALHPTLATTIDSTITMNNDPPSRNATIDDLLETKGLAPAVALKDVFSTLGGGPLCYIYV
ncbi:hypothetical protein PG985_016314 [Apiospora marii]|uniref:uncharacterized protein n=1 Tax=Apiospora marii TaxID=335849 RepID=UPI00312D1078